MTAYTALAWRRAVKKRKRKITGKKMNKNAQNRYLYCACYVVINDDKISETGLDSL